MDEVLTIADGGHLDDWSGHGLFVIVKLKEIFPKIKRPLFLPNNYQARN